MLYSAWGRQLNGGSSEIRKEVSHESYEFSDREFEDEDDTRLLCIETDMLVASEDV